jgi:hypothetical protein
LRAVQLTQCFYGIGASAIREALSMLISDILVQRIDHRGFRVAEVSLSGFDELLKTRSWLEEQALRESIRLGDISWEEALVLANFHLSRVHRTVPHVSTRRVAKAHSNMRQPSCFGRRHHTINTTNRHPTRAAANAAANAKLLNTIFGFLHHIDISPPCSTDRHRARSRTARSLGNSYQAAFGRDRTIQTFTVASELK